MCTLVSDVVELEDDEDCDEDCCPFCFPSFLEDEAAVFEGLTSLLLVKRTLLPPTALGPPCLTTAALAAATISAALKVPVVFSGMKLEAGEAAAAAAPLGTGEVSRLLSSEFVSIGSAAVATLVVPSAFLTISNLPSGCLLEAPCLLRLIFILRLLSFSLSLALALPMALELRVSVRV